MKEQEYLSMSTSASTSIRIYKYIYIYTYIYIYVYIYIYTQIHVYIYIPFKGSFKGEPRDPLGTAWDQAELGACQADPKAGLPEQPCGIPSSGLGLGGT